MGYQPIGAVISYGNGNGDDFKRTTNVNGATSYPWGSENVDGAADYAFNAVLNGVPSNAPTFSNLANTASVSDSAVAGTSVFTVAVSDVDGDIQSTEMTNASPYFSFDTSTLEVSVLSTAPAGAYPLNFKVTDRCTNTATATLSVTVADPCTGSSSPTFSDATPTASISTTAAVGTTVSTLTVSDVDGGTLTTVMTSSSPYFTFDTSSLEVTVLSSVPEAVYPLNFEVTDDCSNTATATLSVTVTDPCTGTSSPTFSDAPPTASISTTAAVGTTVSTLTVSDVDGGTLTTVMTSSSTYFTFDTSSLEVTVLSSVPEAVYALNFEVTDDCSNTATATLSVTVTDPCTGSLSPTFSDATPTASISTTAAVGTTVSTLTVSDVDGGTLNTVMTSSSLYFTFDTSSLEVTVLSSVPEAVYALNFEVTDDCSNTATATLSVTVTDPCTGTSSPTFSDATPTASISTTAAVGTTVSTLTVSDLDGGTLTTVMTSSSLYFMFDTSSLEVQVSSTVPAGSYSLTFQTSDDCSNNAIATLSITVLSLSQVTPTFSVSTAMSTMPDDYSIGTTVVRLTVTDPDGGTTTTSMTSSSTYFELDPVTLDVKVLSSLTSGTYVLEFQVVDNDGHTGTSQLNITVDNAKPLITSLPTYAYLTESTTAETLLHTLVTSDASPSDTVTCLLVASDPTSSDFTVKLVSGTSYGIYSLASHSFNYVTTKRYKLTINCTDTKDDVSGSFYVYILPNRPPTFTNLPNSISVAHSSSSGTSVFHVTGSDTEGDTLTFSMSCSSCPFQITNGGEISTNQVLSGSTVGYDIFVLVTDATTSVGPNVLTVKISDINADPVITNLPFPSNISVLENQPVGTAVFTVVSGDVDTSQTLVYSLLVTPSSGQTLFTIDSNGVITTTLSIDYDTQTDVYFNIAVTVSDGQASDTEPLYVIIQNENEAPSFSSIAYYLSAIEEEVRGTSLGTPSYGVTDPDLDSINYSIDCYQFLINSSTGEITFYAAYDLDLAGSSSTISCIVSADDGELTGTATLIVTINDINDNSPIFDNEIYSFTSSVSAKSGAVIGTVSATDADYSTLYGAVTFTINQTLLSTNYFGVSGTGSLFAVQDLSALGSGSVHDVTVTATDTDGNHGSLFRQYLSQSYSLIFPTLRHTHVIYHFLHSYLICMSIQFTSKLIISAIVCNTCYLAMPIPYLHTSLVTIIIPDYTTTTGQVTDSDDRYLTFIEDTKNVAWLTSFCLASFGSMCLIGYLINKYELLKFWRDGLKETFQRKGDKTSKSRNGSDARQRKNERRSSNTNGSRNTTRRKQPMQSSDSGMPRQKIRDIRHFINAQTTQF
ncbi:cadherin-23-like [Mizuhopecten yessoensis]|uniref:cadherin-23-like n=1 Tax=Mizuhopecten yessoensis TaxID=6573 RepID=UPI000B45F0F6|nr:cadherin-23-like [Mizuhopecten yessoensis]